MTARADATLFIDGDASGAQRVLDQTAGRARGLGDAINNAAGRFGDLSNATKHSQERVEKAATAVTGLSSVLGGLGSKAGAAFGALSNLASAVLVGGPLLGGFALLVTGAAALWNELERVKSEADELDKTFDKLARTLADKSKKEIEGIAAALAKVSDEVRFFYLSSGERRIEQAEAREMALMGQRSTLRGLRARQQGRITALQKRIIETPSGDKKNALEEDLALQQRVLSTQTARLEALDTAVSLAAAEVDETRTLLALEKERERVARARAQAEKEAEARGIEDMNRLGLNFFGAKSGVRGSFGSTVTNANIRGGLAAARLAKSKARHQSREDMAAAEQRAEWDEILALEDAGNDLRKKMADEQAKEELRILKDQKAKEKRIQEDHEREVKALRKAYAQEAAAFAVSVLDRGLQSWLTVVEMGIQRQKIDFQAMIGGFIRSTGEQIFAIGAKYAIEGAGMIAMSGGTDPRGYATAAVGAGGMAIGAAMATGGTALSAASSLRGSGGGGGGGAPRRSFSSGGTSGGGGAPGGDGGNVTIVYNGGVHMGDTASDRAQAWRRQQRLATREVYSPEGA